MYGLVNKAIEELVVERFGQDKWEEIKTKADVLESGFISTQSYPDELTFKLVGAASEVLLVPIEDLLEAFGEYWVLYTGAKGYGEMMSHMGNSLPDFLKNLDMLHGRVAGMMPHLQPPQFYTENESERSIDLVYNSHRRGLVPMLRGLILGLGRRFEVNPTIQVLEVEAEKGTKAKLRVTW
jgi:hypothetical protein